MAEDLQTFEGVLAHYGVKGMKWGVRKDRTATEVTTTQKPGDFVKAQGGKYQTASDDAVRAITSRQKAAMSTTDALSNKELQDMVTRMNLEQQYANLTEKSDRRSKGVKLVQKIFGAENAFRDTALKDLGGVNPGLASRASMIAQAIDMTTSAPKKK